MKLALGTVQFGLDYGIANKKGQVSLVDAEKILEIAKNNGVIYLDTAIAYGSSENILGKIGVSWAKLMTKITSIPSDCTYVSDWVNSEVEASLERLKIPKLEVIMLHKASDILSSNGPALIQSFENLKSEGLVNMTGYSIYSPNDLEKLVNHYVPDIVQAPYNLFDRRLEKSGWLDWLKNNKVQVHSRSVFLQGLLLMKKDERPKKFDKWKQEFTHLDKWVCKENISALEAAFGFVYQNKLIDKVVVGVDNPEQMNDVLKLTNQSPINAPALMSSQDEMLLNPSNWSLI